jgi:hypothetical protein
MFPLSRVAVWSSLLVSALLVGAAADGCADSAPADAVSVGAGAPAEGGSTGAPPPTEDASACHPGDVQTYQPSAYHFAAAAWRGVCAVEGPNGNGQDRLFFDKCLVPGATPEGCAAFQADSANAECAKCILTPDATASHDGYGPLINHGTFITTNVAGCVELTDPSALTCAKAVQALDGCELRACEANCPVQDENSRAAYETCATVADHAGCVSYDMAAACVSSEAAAAPSCLLPTFADFYYAVVPLFCGVPPELDGGGPAGIDASEPSPAEASALSPIDAPATALEDGGVDAAIDVKVDAATDATGDTAFGAKVDAPIDARPADATDESSDASRD